MFDCNHDRQTRASSDWCNLKFDIFNSTNQQRDDVNFKQLNNKLNLNHMPIYHENHLHFNKAF